MTDYISLLIRFNWPHPVWAGRPESDYFDWLEKRLELFDAFTAKSLLNLYAQPDLIAILVDPARDTSPSIKERLSHSLRRIKNNLQFIDYNPGFDIGSALKSAISNRSGIVNFDRLVTTRLDSDDLIASGFFAKLRSTLKTFPHKEGVLTFPGGCTYDTQANSFYYSSYCENPFISLIEDPHKEVYTVFKKMHTEIIDYRSGLVAIRSNQPDWASVIHGSNLANNSLSSMSKFSILETDDLKKVFGIL